MSGGHFDYQQYHVSNIADSIENELNKQGTLKPKDELYYTDEYYSKYPDEKYYAAYPIEIQEKMKDAIKILRTAAIYAHRIDWLLSGDDGEESFLERLKEELDKLE